MKVRYPALDFSKIRPHWAPHAEFAQMYNANSMVPAHIEPYLIKVMIQAKAALHPKHKKLHEELTIFIKQEAQHTKQHKAFNEVMYDAGYDVYLEHEKAYAADYDRFLAEKSLRFNCAYSEGFEAIGSNGAPLMFEQYDQYLEGADPNAVALWKWHLAEEFEHRTVAFDVYHTLFGRGPLAYFYRIYGYYYAVKHIRGHTNALFRALIKQDRASMSPKEVERSRERVKAMKKHLAKVMMPSALAVFSPFYNPRRHRKPKGLDAYLKIFETGHRAPSAA
jgi:predicted metal-dependent hydrolase